MDRQIEMGDTWELDWLERTQPYLVRYLDTFTYFVIFAISILGFHSFCAIRASTKELVNNPSKRAEICSAVDKKVLKLMRGQFIVANVLMFNVLTMTLVDTYVCTRVISDDIESEPEAWTMDLLPSMATYIGYLLVIFAATFFLVPLLQMLFVTWILGRFSKKHGSNALSEYIPQARFLSTHIAQFWCLLAFLVVSCWSPTSESSLGRYTLLQASIGSACAWLQASFAFNYRADKLQDVNVASSGRVRDILHMFNTTVVQTYKTTAEVLPVYEDLTQDTPLLNEKQ